MIDALIQAYRLKDEVRSGWQIRGVSNPESVADHSWGTSYLVLVYADDAGVDRSTAIEMATVHDIAEALTGDVATRLNGLDDTNERQRKQRREREAMRRLTEGYPDRSAKRVLELWDEYEACRTAEARFVRDMNLIDMCLQAYCYEADGRYDRTPGVAADASIDRFPDFRGLDEFFATTAPRLQTDFGRARFSDVADRYARLPSVATRGGLRLEADPRPEREPW